MIQAWGVPDVSGNTLMDLPALDNKETQAKVDAWNAKLVDAGTSARVTGGGSIELRCTNKKGWF